MLTYTGFETETDLRGKTPCTSDEPEMTERDLVNQEGEEMRMIIMGTDGCESPHEPKSAFGLF